MHIQNNRVPGTDAAGDKEDDAGGGLRDVKPEPWIHLHRSSLLQVLSFSR